MECGGCLGLGSHRRWCPASVGPRAAMLGGAADRLAAAGDLIGASDTVTANRCYSLAGRLRTMAVAASTPQLQDDGSLAIPAGPVDDAETWRRWRADRSGR